MTAPLHWQRLAFPARVEPDQVIAFLRALHGMSTPGRQAPFILQTTANPDGVQHYLATPDSRRDAVRTQASAAVPGLVLTDTDRPTTTATAAWRVWQSSSRRPLRTDDSAGISKGLLAALTGLHGGETLTLQWWLGPVRRGLVVPTNHVPVVSESWWIALLTAPVFGPKHLDTEARRALRAKQSEPGWRAVGRIAVSGATRERARSLLGHLVAALRAAEGPGAALGVRPVSPAVVAASRTPWFWGFAVSIHELAGLLAWPLGDEPQAPVTRRTARYLPAPRQVPHSGRIVSVDPLTDRPLALHPTDALQHLHLVGPTGVGKSTVLLNLITQDMAAGRSVVVIEPKGDLIADVLARVPVHRRDDVVLLDPGDTTPVGLNPLRGSAPELVADQLLSIFAQLYSDSWGPRLSDVLHAALLTLARTPGASLAMLPLLLTDERLRRTILRQVHDPFGVTPFWGWFESLGDPERQTVVAPVLNKVRPLLVRPSLRGVLGQAEPRFDLRQVFTRRTILLANLAKGTVGPGTARLLGTLLVHELWQTTLGRTRLEPARRHPVMVVVDEVQDYLGLPTGIGEVLSQSRGLGVGWALAHQHLGQLPPVVRAAVLANARSRMVFQADADDAQTLSRGHRELTAEDLARLPVREAYLRLVVDSEVTPYFSGRTLPSPNMVSDPEELRRASRNRYGVDRQETDDQLRRLTEPRSRPDAPIGSRRRPA